MPPLLNPNVDPTGANVSEAEFFEALNLLQVKGYPNTSVEGTLRGAIVAIVKHLKTNGTWDVPAGGKRGKK